MRILVLSDNFPPANPGGAGAVAFAVARRLAEWGHEINVATYGGDERFGHVSRQHGLTVHRLRSPWPRRFRLYLSLLHPWLVARIARLVRELQPDVVHAHNLHEHLSLAALAAARITGAPLVLTVHDYRLFCLTKFLCAGHTSAGSENRAALANSRRIAQPDDLAVQPLTCRYCGPRLRFFPVRNRLIRWLVDRHVTALVCISEAQRAALAANGFHRAPLTTIHNGVDPASCWSASGEREAWRRRHGLDERPLILFGGRISGTKGGDQLVRALAVARRRVDAQLAVLGENLDYLRFLEKLADDEGVGGQVHGLGWLSGDDLRQAFAAADVIATPSVYPDPFNLMNIEAMAHERPVVATCYGGAPEIVVQGETGFIADPWDEAAFGDRLATVLANRKLARAMGEAGRQRVLDRFTLDRQVSAYVSAYQGDAAWRDGSEAAGAGMKRASSES
ncbi:MAG: hypothetical protein CL878_11005 [Dehalococcoidia bacterium]|nr:hypothetical protein [Dehalococcoidia bacterium]